MEAIELMSPDGEVLKYGCGERGVRYREKNGSKTELIKL